MTHLPNKICSMFPSKGKDYKPYTHLKWDDVNVISYPMLVLKYTFSSVLLAILSILCHTLSFSFQTCYVWWLCRSQTILRPLFLCGKSSLEDFGFSAQTCVFSLKIQLCFYDKGIMATIWIHSLLKFII